MKPSLPTPLAGALREFFADHLPRLRGLSPHTVHSYRDSLLLLLRFTAQHHGTALVTLDLDRIGSDEVIGFLEYLETDRHNAAVTRNVRLAAIHAFFRFLATRNPEHLERCQRILAVPFKRAHSRSIEYLEYEEIQAVLAAIDRRTPDGRRDYVLLATMFNIGARVQEILDLRPRDLQLVRPFQVRLMGKGHKERLCPVWPQTAELLKEWLRDSGTDPDTPQPLFRNHRGHPLTRFGVRYILRKYCDRARAHTPTLVRKRLHPHSMRHSTAVHLLRSGVDLVTISHWLGHASVNTTNRYVTVDLDMKRQAIAKARPIDESHPALAPWKTDASILAWLEGL